VLLLHTLPWSWQKFLHARHPLSAFPRSAHIDDRPDQGRFRRTQSTPQMARDLADFKPLAQRGIPDARKDVLGNRAEVLR
jgi:hypothetical protein